MNIQRNLKTDSMNIQTLENKLYKYPKRLENKLYEYPKKLENTL
jgi:hypothetical protein